MLGSHFWFSLGEDHPNAVASGRLKGVLREPLDTLPAGAPWSGDVQLAVEDGEYVAYYRYAIQGNRLADCYANWVAVGLTAGADLPDVLPVAMRAVVGKVERARVGGYTTGASNANRRLLRVTKAEWVADPVSQAGRTKRSSRRRPRS